MMGFWRSLLGLEDTTDTEPAEERSLPAILPSPWAGWPEDWHVPNWDFGPQFENLVDVAWNCIDLNASVLSAMPVYRTRDGRVVEPATWMANPDPLIYSSWAEFAKQLFWDFQLGEAFVLPVLRTEDGMPVTFRVIPPWMMHVEIRDAQRIYRLGGTSGADVTDEVLHIRYRSTTDQARGVGPLEVAGGKILTAALLSKYMHNVVKRGGISYETLESPEPLSEQDAQDLMKQWLEARAKNFGAPPVLDNGVRLNLHSGPNPRDMAMLELAQFTESRIANLLGVPPFLVGLPSGGDSMTYSNVSQLFDFHDRASLRPKAVHVMTALSAWALPPNEAAELNRDEYTRPSFEQRADAWVKLKSAGLISTEQFQAAERLHTPAASAALSGSTGEGTSTREAATPRELAEMIQKIYLGVNVVITPEEARQILNDAGARLFGPGPAPAVRFDSVAAASNGRTP